MNLFVFLVCFAMQAGLARSWDGITRRNRH